MHLDDSDLNQCIDGRLEGTRSRQVQQHLRSCPTCRSRKEALETLGASLVGLPEIPLRRDLVAPVLARLVPKPRSALLGWITALEGVGAAALATYLWPRIVELATPLVTTLAPAAASLWTTSFVGTLEAAGSQLELEVRSLAYGADLWLRSLGTHPALAWPIVAALGITALVLGVLGNGVLLREPARPG